jgi:hypothetical protein
MQEMLVVNVEISPLSGMVLVLSVIPVVQRAGVLKEIIKNNHMGHPQIKTAKEFFEN